MVLKALFGMQSIIQEVVKCSIAGNSMVKNKKSVEYRPILLTGSHRSGTTWAANIIQLSNELSLIMEPFNDANNRYGIFNKKPA